MTGAGKTRLQQETLRLLEERPALYADAKAFLLSELSLLNPAKERTLSPLAGATYRRFVRPWGAAQPSVAATDLTPVVKAVLDIARLRLLDDAASIEPVQAGLGFYEALDDATYDNSFEVTVGGQQIEPFEAVVDPGSLGAKTWKTATPATPIAEDQTKPVRRVPLASRRSVKAPIMTGSAVIAAFQAGGLKKGQQLNLAALYAGQALVSPTGDHRVQDAWRSSQAPAFEEQIFTLIYVVQGDEEGDQGSNALFNNDLFSIDLVAIERHQAAISDRREPRTPHPLAAQLGGLVSSPRGSPEARQQIAALAPALAQVAAEFVKPPPSPPTAPTVGFQILPDGVGFKIQPVGDLAAAARKALRNIAFLRREGQKDSGSGLLIVDVATDVWDELGVRLTQTRNAVTPVYAFDPAFRQGAAQATPPAHRRPTKAGRNTPLAWVRPGPVKLPNRRISVKDLLYALKAAPMDGVAGALFTPSKAIASGYRLSVSVFEEQFLRPARANFPAPQPEGRLLAFNVQCAMSETSVAQTMIEFPKPGAAFSVDLHWTAPGGDVALRLERLFVRTTADAS
jgi:hypothetical protein